MRSKDFRGSRLHMLEWIKSDKFIQQFNDMLIPTGAHIEKDAWYRPTKDDPREARLGYNMPEIFRNVINWEDLTSWWLEHRGAANIPNWDFSATCYINGLPRMVLVEAKAHKSELKKEGKILDHEASKDSVDNHKKIARTLAETCRDLNKSVPGVNISIDRCYQLSNRVAFARKLTEWVPVVLVYLGFLGDNYFADYFGNTEDWKEAMLQYMAPVLPKDFIDRRITCGSSFMQMVIRSRPILRKS